MYIIKRTGEKVPFDETKIINAITRAYQEVQLDSSAPEPEYARPIAHEISLLAEKDPEPFKVEDIQDLVEDMLTQYDKRVA